MPTRIRLPTCVYDHVHQACFDLPSFSLPPSLALDEPPEQRRTKEGWCWPRGGENKLISLTQPAVTPPQHDINPKPRLSLFKLYESLRRRIGGTSARLLLFLLLLLLLLLFTLLLLPSARSCYCCCYCCRSPVTTRRTPRERKKIAEFRLRFFSERRSARILPTILFERERERERERVTCSTKDNEREILPKSLKIKHSLLHRRSV